MRVYIKKLHENAVMPKHAKEGDAGLDLTAVSATQDAYWWEYGTGLAIAIPTDCVGLLFPRSSISNTRFSLSNAVGVLDSGYRGEIKARFRIENYNQPPYKIGDRILQLVIVPKPEVNLIETSDLDDTERGTGGFGSTGS